MWFKTEHRVLDFGEVGQERGHPSCGLHPQAVETGEESPGNRGRQDDPRPLRPSKSKLLTLRIPNPSHYSYANSLVFSPLWSASCTGCGMQIHGHKMRQFFLWLSQQQKPQPLWQTLAWRPVTQGWDHSLRQRDPAELLKFLQPQLFEGLCAGIWRSRPQNSSNLDPNSAQDVGSGHAWPIVLPAAFPSEPAPTLQECVDGWRTCTQACELSAPPPFLALQVPLFDDTGTKRPFNIQGTWQASFPCSNPSGISTNHEPFQAVASIVHSGSIKVISKLPCSRTEASPI